MFRIISILAVTLWMSSGAAWADTPANVAPPVSKVASPPAPSSQAESIRIQLTTPNDAKLASPMAGKIIELPFRDGTLVKKDDTLVKFLCDEREARLVQARAHVQQAAARANGTSKLDKLGSASKVDLEVQQAELVGAHGEEALAQAQANDCLIKAPFDGHVANVVVKAFSTVQEGQPLLELVGDSPLESTMIVPSHWLSWLKVGYAFTIHIDETGKRYASTVTRIGGSIDPVTQSVPIYATLNETAPDLMSGMSGIAELSPPAEHAP
jgi:membrane fusion protein (multidrug efflux system)